MLSSERVKLAHIVPLEMKGCICHFTEWQIHPFISKGTTCRFICHFTMWQIYPLISKGTTCRFLSDTLRSGRYTLSYPRGRHVGYHTKCQIHPFKSKWTTCRFICHFTMWQIHPFISKGTTCRFSYKVSDTPFQIQGDDM